MRNFHKIASGMDTLAIVNAVQRSGLWNENTLRTTHPDTPHGQVDDIWLRFNDLSDPSRAAIMDQHESVNYPAMWKLPVRGLIFDLMRRVEGERLGRVLITRLAPGARITPHVDGGDHAAYYDRYHVVLQNLPGSTFRAGRETVYMAGGDIWWFDNSQEHEVINNSTDDRLTMIVDIRTGR